MMEEQLAELAKANGYSRISIFVNPTTKPDPAKVIEDMTEFFRRLNNGDESQLLYSSKK